MIKIFQNESYKNLSKFVNVIFIFFITTSLNLLIFLFYDIYYLKIIQNILGFVFILLISGYSSFILIFPNKKIISLESIMMILLMSFYLMFVFGYLSNYIFNTIAIRYVIIIYDIYIILTMIIYVYIRGFKNE